MLNLEGAVIGGDYRVVKPLASGGMGGVYLAQQLSTGSQRALKIMHPTLIANPRMRERFAQEARVGAHIQSQHVVQVIGAGVDADQGVPWLAMELLEGEDLAAFAARRGALPFAELLAIFRELCHALGAAHAAGIVHRDVKPENVFLATVHGTGQRWQVKVLDFGIAKLVADAQEAATGQIGTPLWMAPEQSDAAQPITPAADVWSLGLLAFRLLTGRHYWRVANESSGVLSALFRETIVEPLVPASVRAREYGVESLLPPGFDQWFAHAVVREVDARFRTASDAFAALEALAPHGAAGTGPGEPAIVPTAPAAAYAATASAPVPTPAGSTLSASHSNISQATAPRSKLPLALGFGALLVIGLGAVAVGAGAFFFRDELGLSTGGSPSAPASTAAVPGPTEAGSVTAPGTSEPEPATSGAKPSPTAARAARTSSPVGATTKDAPPAETAPPAAPEPSAETAKPEENAGGVLDVAATQKKVDALAAQTAVACSKEKSPGNASESYSGFLALHPDGSGGGGMQGMGGAQPCVKGRMLSMRVPKFSEPKGTQTFAWSVVVK